MPNDTDPKKKYRREAVKEKATEAVRSDIGTEMLRSIVGSVLPPNAAQMVAHKATEDTKYGFADMSAPMRFHAMRSVRNARRRNNADHGGTEYLDYSDEIARDLQNLSGDLPSTVGGSYMSPEFQAATTLGRVSYDYDPATGTYTLYDSYDFSPIREDYDPETTYGDVRKAMGRDAVQGEPNVIGRFTEKEYKDLERQYGTEGYYWQALENPLVQGAQWISEKTSNLFDFKEGGKMPNDTDPPKYYKVPPPAYARKKGEDEKTYYRRMAQQEGIDLAYPEQYLLGMGAASQVPKGFNISKSMLNPTTLSKAKKYGDKALAALLMYGNEAYDLASSVFDFENGGKTSEDPEMMYKDKYNTQLSPEEQVAFSQWAAKESDRQGRNILNDMGSYDVQGFWKSGDYMDMDADNHGSDRWKKPNHPTFSNQSIYSGVDGMDGGTWTDNGGYRPSPYTMSLYDKGYYDWMFGLEPHRPEHLDMTINLPAKGMGKLYVKGGQVKKEMIKRADGSYSQRGLWDNIRANKGSGRKPSKEMLQQEKEIMKNKKYKKYFVGGAMSAVGDKLISGEDMSAKDLGRVALGGALKSMGGMGMPMPAMAKKGMKVSRFDKLKGKIMKSGKNEDAAAAIAAAIGRKKYGKTKFQQMAAAGRRKSK